MAIQRLALATALLAAACAHSEIPLPPEPVVGGDHGWPTDDVADRLAEVASRPVPEDATEEYVFDRTHIRWDEDGRATRTEHKLVRVIDAAGAEAWSSVSARFRPWYEAQPEIRARVLTPDGRMHVLDPATLTTSPVGSDSSDVYVDTQMLHGPLPAVAPGCVVELMIRYRHERPFFEAGVASRWFLARNSPVRELSFVLDAPASLPLAWRLRALDLEPEVRRRDGRQTVRFELRDLPPAPTMPWLLPRDQVRWPLLEWSTGRSWDEVATRYSALVDERIRGADLSSLLEDPAKGEGATAGPAPTDPRGVAARLLRRLRAHVRYTGVEFGAAAIVPRSPAQVLETRYGDCKDQAALLVAGLRAQGFEAHVALLDTGEHEDVAPDLPGLGQFNHAIVYVGGSDPFWIDPVAPFVPAGELPLDDQGRLALVAAPGTRALVRTPRATAQQNWYRELRELYLADLGKARLVEVTEGGGQRVYDLREGFDGNTDESLAEWADEYVTELYNSGRVTGTTLTPPADLEQPFSLRLVAEDVQRGITSLEDAATFLQPEAVAAALPEEMMASAKGPIEREQDLQLRMPFVSEIAYRIHPAPGLVPRAFPKDRTWNIGTAVLSRRFVTDKDGTVEAVFRLDTGEGRFSPADVGEMREALEALLTRDEALLMFDHQASLHIAAGRVPEGLRLHRELVRAHPDVPAHRIRYAQALLGLGFTAAARAETEAALAVAPDDPRVAARHAMVLQHGPLGVLRGPGHDHEAAVAAYRRAVDLDPKNDETVADLAILLEHDAQGRRYVGAGLSEAIELYRGIHDRGATAFDDNLLVAMFKAGRYDDVVAFAPDAKAGEVRSQIWVAALARTQNVEAAVAKAERLAGGRQEQSLTILQQAASQLLLAREYELASTLLRRAVKGPAQVQLIPLMRMLERTRRLEPIPLDAQEPVSAVRGILQALTQLGTGGADEPARWLSRAATAEFEGQDMNRLMKAEVISAFEGAGSDPTMVAVMARLGLDMALSNMDVKLDGDDQIGWQVKVRIPADKEEIHQTWYVVREAGGYRVRGIEAPGLLGTLATEAQDRLAAGDPETARTWLAWALADASERRGPDGPPGGFLAATLWRGGEASDAELPVIAAAQLADTQVHLPSLKRAERILAEAAAKEGDPEVRDMLKLVLATVHFKVGRGDVAIAALRDLVEQRPTSGRALQTLATYLFMAGRGEEAEPLLAARVAEVADLPHARLLGELLNGPGRLAEYVARLEANAAHEDAAPTDLNNLAWALLFVDGERELTRAAGLAERANLLTAYGNRAKLHTLATVYAEEGRPAQAWQVLQRAVSRDTTGLATHDWYVVGRVAEHYGLIDVAREAYGRVEPAERPSSVDTWLLAQRRLKGL